MPGSRGQVRSPAILVPDSRQGGAAGRRVAAARTAWQWCRTAWLGVLTAPCDPATPPGPVWARVAKNAEALPQRRRRRGADPMPGFGAAASLSRAPCVFDTRTPAVAPPSARIGRACSCAYSTRVSLDRTEFRTYSESTHVTW